VTFTFTFTFKKFGPSLQGENVDSLMCGRREGGEGASEERQQGRDIMKTGERLDSGLHSKDLNSL